jgi:hypothetical protein
MNASVLASSHYSFQQKIKKNLIQKGFDMRPQFIDWARELTPQEKRLLETLFDFIQEKEGWHGIFPSVKTLAWRSQMSLRNCHRVKASLKQKGFIDWVTIRDPKTRQLRCHFEIKEKVLGLSQRDRGERYSLPRLVTPFFGPKRGGDKRAQPVVTASHTYKYIKHASHVIQLEILRGGVEFLRNCSFRKITTEGKGGLGKQGFKKSVTVKNSFLVLPENFESKLFRTSSVLNSSNQIKLKTNLLSGETHPPSPPSLAAQGAKRQKLARVEVSFLGVDARVQVPVELLGETLAQIGLVTSGQGKGKPAKGVAAKPKQKSLKTDLKNSDQNNQHQSVKAPKTELVKPKPEEAAVSEEELKFSKSKQVGKKAESSDYAERQKQKQAEYRKKVYEKNKEKLQELRQNQPPKRTESKKKTELNKQAEALFQFFLARCKDKNLESETQSLQPLERWCAAQMIDRLGMHDAEKVVTWALDHWQELLKKDDRLCRNPYFHNLTAYHRYTYYLRKATVDSVQATQKEKNDHKAKGYWGEKPVRVKNE